MDRVAREARVAREGWLVVLVVALAVTAEKVVAGASLEVMVVVVVVDMHTEGHQSPAWMLQEVSI